MARRKSKYCTACEMTFLGNHACVTLGKKVLYDDPIMVSLTKSISKGPDIEKKEPEQSEFSLPWKEDPNDPNNNSGRV